MLMPGRHWNADKYRFGFQGQEKDDEIKGVGNSINYKFRMHDPRIGRFFAIDPLAAEYPYNSTYAFSENRVLDGIELEGAEWQPIYTKPDNYVETPQIIGYRWIGWEYDGPRRVSPEGTVENAALPYLDQVGLYSVDENGDPTYRLVNRDITESDYSQLAKSLKVEVNALKAFAIVESPKGPFWQGSQGQATILFERHIMYKRLTEDGVNISTLKSNYCCANQMAFDRIVNKKSGGYGQRVEQYTKLSIAKGMNYEAAIKSSSWGQFQVLGDYYKDGGYNSLEELEYAMNYSAAEQFRYFSNFLTVTSPLVVKALRKKDWKMAAKWYNGGSRVSIYAPRLKQAYDQLNKQSKKTK